MDERDAIAHGLIDVERLDEQTTQHSRATTRNAATHDIAVASEDASDGERGGGEHGEALHGSLEGGGGKARRARLERVWDLRETGNLLRARSRDAGNSAKHWLCRVGERQVELVVGKKGHFEGKAFRKRWYDLRHHIFFFRPFPSVNDLRCHGLVRHYKNLKCG
jgi:hypothetical protein